MKKAEVWIIDDDVRYLRSLQARLGPRKRQAKFFDSTLTAQSAIRGGGVHAPEFIFCDWKMGDEDPERFLLGVMRRQPAVKCILNTGFAPQLGRSRIFELGRKNVAVIAKNAFDYCAIEAALFVEGGMDEIWRKYSAVAQYSPGALGEPSVKGVLSGREVCDLVADAAGLRSHRSIIADVGFGAAYGLGVLMIGFSVLVDWGRLGAAWVVGVVGILLLVAAPISYFRLSGLHEALWSRKD